MGRSPLSDSFKVLRFTNDVTPLRSGICTTCPELRSITEFSDALKPDWVGEIGIGGGLELAGWEVCRGEVGSH